MGDAHSGATERLEPAEPGSRAPFWGGSGRWLAAGVVAACVLSGLMVVVYWWWAPFGVMGGAGRGAGSSSLPRLDPPSQKLRDEAFQASDVLVQALPRDPEAMYSKAAIHSRFGDSTVAVASWERAIELEPKLALAYYCLGRSALERGESEKCLELLHKAVQIDPTMGHAYLLLGQALMDLGRMDDARRPLETHLQLVPRSVEGHFRLGQIYLRAKQHQRAEQYFRAALEINPGCDAAYEGLAAVCTEQGNAQQAEKYRERLAELKRLRGQRGGEVPRPAAPDRAELLSGLGFAHTDVGKVYAARGRLPEAINHWRRAAEVDPKETESRKLLVMTYQRAQRLEDALRFLRELSLLEPNDPIHQINIGVLSSELGQFEAAETAFRKVRELVPDRHEGYAGLAKLYLQSRRDPGEAEKLAEKAVKLAPLADNYYLLGMANLLSGNTEQGLAALQQAVERGPGNPVYRQALDDARAENARKKKTAAPTSDATAKESDEEIAKTRKSESTK